MITNFSSYAQAICRSQATRLSEVNFQNYSTFFQLVFGINAVQTATLLRIKKADLTVSANNSAQSLFVALLLNSLSLRESSESITSIRWKTFIANEKKTHVILINLYQKITLSYDEITNYLGTIDPDYF